MNKKGLQVLVFYKNYPVLFLWKALISIQAELVLSSFNPFLSLSSFSLPFLDFSGSLTKAIHQITDALSINVSQ